MFINGLSGLAGAIAVSSIDGAVRGDCEMDFWRMYHHAEWLCNENPEIV